MGTKTVAVLGAGHGGCAAAADLGRRGFSVRLHTRNPQRLAALAAAGAASAQAVNASGDTAVNPPAASADFNAAPAGGYASSDTLGDTSKLKAGDPSVVSNPPVPDTQENRAKFGRPMSHAGRVTAPNGD